MRVRNGDIWGAQEAIRKLADLKLPVKYALPIARFCRQASAEFALIAEQRNALIGRLGESVEGKPPFLNPQSENWVEFAAEHNELMGMECPTGFTSLALPDDVVMSVADLNDLNVFFPEEEEQASKVLKLA